MNYFLMHMEEYDLFKTDAFQHHWVKLLKYVLHRSYSYIWKN